MLDLLSIGTVTVDLYYKGTALTEKEDRFELAIGGKYFADHFYEGLGGGGANVAIGAVKSGLKVGLMANIGENPFKKLIFDKLLKAGVEFGDLSRIEDEYINISSILLSKSGEKTVINYRSGHQKICSTSSDLEKILLAKNMYMANLSSVSLNERIEILRFAKRNDVTTFANLNVTDCRRKMEEIAHFLRYLDVLFLNTYEFADMVKTGRESVDFESDVVSRFSPLRKDLLLVVTDGKKGSYGYFGGKVFYEKAVPDVKCVDSTGAGDGYTAGFLGEYLKGGDVKKSMRAGSEYAGKIVARLGAN